MLIMGAAVVCELIFIGLLLSFLRKHNAKKD
jgi:hypothetical protein